jgi:CRP-like cAMP-binding protein
VTLDPSPLLDRLERRADALDAWLGLVGALGALGAEAPGDALSAVAAQGVTHALAAGQPVAALAVAARAKAGGVDVAPLVDRVHAALALVDEAAVPPPPPGDDDDEAPRSPAPLAARLAALAARPHPAPRPSRALPLLSELERADLGALASVARVRALEPGEALFAAGDRADALFFVATGRLEVGRDGGAPIVLESGAVVGELALLLGAARTRSVHAATRAAVLELSASAIAGLAQRSAGLSRALAALGRARIVKNLVEASPLFRGVEPAAQRALLAQLTPTVFEDGRVILAEGAVPEALHVVAAGAARVELRDADGDRRTVARLGAGEVFGEIGLLGDQPATATVFAEGKCVTFALPRAALRGVLDARPALRAELEALAAARSAHNVAERAGAVELADDALIVT